MSIPKIFKDLKHALPKACFIKLQNQIYYILTAENKLSCFLDFKKNIQTTIDTLQDLKSLFIVGLILVKHKYYYPSLIIFYCCLVKDSNNSDAYFNLGICFKNLNKARLAIIYFNKQKKCFGNTNNLTYQLAKCYQTNGDLKLSEEHFCELLDHDKFLFEAHREYSIIHKYIKDDPHLKVLHDLEKLHSVNDKNKKFIFFALSKAYEDLKNYEKSFYYLSHANILRKKELFYSPSVIKNQFQSIKESYAALVDRADLKPNKINKTPIKIVGLPRSGTTLLEQIISSHSKVYSMAESLAFPKCIKEFFPSADPVLFKNEVKSMNFKILKRFRENYFKMQFAETNKDFITDKLPFNYIFLGLINKFIPESKIIHIKRDSKDTCLSILKNYFIGENISFAYNEADLIDYYYQYDDLMKFWKSNCSGYFLEIRYEELIENFDNSIKKILTFLNLNYEESVKNFYKNKSSVFSLSLAQVRSPIYRSSINSWKNFEPYLSDNFKRLP